jgi:hypothetical protein
MHTEILLCFCLRVPVASERDAIGMRMLGCSLSSLRLFDNAFLASRVACVSAGGGGV